MVLGAPVETGVVYERGDYAGFWRRLLIIVVDLGVLAVLFLTIAAPLRLADPPWVLIPAIVILVLGSYLVVPKAVGVGTLGYLAAGVRLVGLDGRPPSALKLLVRTGLVALMGALLVIDLIWLLGNECRQGLRDQWLGMYVVRRGAEPVASGPVRDSLHFVMGYCIGFPEVVAPGAGVVERSAVRTGDRDS